MSDQPPHFHAMQSAFWNKNRHVYRIYVQPGKLLLLRLGSGYRDPTSAAAAGGALGALVAASLAGKSQQEMDDKKKMLDAASPDVLETLAQQDEGSFVAGARELQELCLDLPSGLWGAVLSGTTFPGVLTFTHAQRGQFTLEILSADDMVTAFEELPPAFGKYLNLKVQWDGTQSKFVRR